MPLRQRRAQLNKQGLTLSLRRGQGEVSTNLQIESIPNSLYDSIARLGGGGVKYAWHKASGLLDKCKVENGKWKIFTRHCEACEARRGNPVGITPSGFQPPSPSREGKSFFAGVNILAWNICYQLSRHSERSEESSQIPLDCFTTFAMTKLCKSLLDFFNFTFKLAFNLPANIFIPSTFQLFNFSTNTPGLKVRCKAC